MSTIILSIEEKAKRYDEAIEKFKPIYDLAKKENRTIDVKEFEDIFPELKESEDERIRQFLIQEVTGTSDEIMSYSNMNKKDVLAWLEAQGNIDSQVKLPTFTFDDVLALQCCMETVKKVQEDKELYEQLQSLHNRLYDAYQLEKQGEQKPIISNDALREGIAHFGITQYQIDNWLKKYVNIEKRDDTKPDDNVEPKFHKSDWVILTAGELSTTLQIVKVDTDKKLYWFNDSSYLPIVDEECLHLWVIQDAKDGDVLSYVTDEEDLWIMIYWSLYEPYEGHVHYHALLVNNNFSDKGTCCISIDDLKPATKEQRELLFKKMKEAGYEWDAEKKELKKIEQKPKFRIGDTIKKKSTGDIVTISEIDLKNREYRLSNTGFIPFKYEHLWELVELNPAWSEEDIVAIDCAVEVLSKDLPSLAASIKRLKSLRPQTIWKPSITQLNALSIVSKGNAPDDIEEIKSLYNDLKKLREE